MSHFCNVICGLICVGSFLFLKPDWGFFAHKKINYYAVFCLPQEMIAFYKNNIDYLAENATNPDSRRYAVKGEGPKHYFDTEAYLEGEHESIPISLNEAVVAYTHWNIRDAALNLHPHYRGLKLITLEKDTFYISEAALRYFYFNKIVPESIDGIAVFDSILVDSIWMRDLSVRDDLLEKGVSPYHLSYLTQLLTKAFRDLDKKRILFYSSEIGHYVSDLCVPLHTTENYNGQLTNQEGIHALWESAIPEKLAENEWNFFIDDLWKIDDFDQYFHYLRANSFDLVEEVLRLEKKVRSNLGQDELFCFEERNGQVTKQPCTYFVQKYNEALDGMVEQQMRLSIHSVASVWYSCWENAGRPFLSAELDSVPYIDSTFVVDSAKAVQFRQHNY